MNPRLALLTALSISVAPAMAQEACPARDSIVALSDLILEQRASLPRLQARNFGAEAAYLKIRYGGLSKTETQGLLTGLLGNDIRGLRELAFAWFVATDGVAVTSEGLGPEAMEAATLASPTTIRALVLADAADVVLDAVARKPEAERISFAHPILAALIDQPDALKQRVGAMAEEKGLIDIAARLYATEREPADWVAFVERLGDAERAADLARRSEMLPVYVGGAPLPGIEHSNAAVWAKLAEVIAGAIVQPEVEYLNGFVNQTGLVEEAARSAAALLAQHGEGTLPAFGPLDPGWLFTYESLKAETGDAAMVDATLQSMSIGSRLLRSTTAEVLDWIIAVDALRAYAAGEAADLPQAPEGPGETIGASWEEWTEIARLVREQAAADAFTTDARRMAMAAELMLAAGQHAAIAEMLAAAAPSSTSVGLAADMAKRLDRGACEGFLWHAAESIVLINAPIYKFDVAASEGGEQEATERVKN